jgi:predicted lipase
MSTDTMIFLSTISSLLSQNLLQMVTARDKKDQTYRVRVLQDSVKFYLPRVEGYLEIVRNMASKYGAMSLIEFDGYFQGKFEPVKYTRVEIHTNDIDEEAMTEYANKIRLKLNQESLAFEYNNRLILVSRF